jgi:hypothetical protein
VAPQAAPEQVAERIPFSPGFLTDDLSDLERVRLVGSRCGNCGISLLGRRRRCENCTSADLRDEVFEPGGTVYSFTVQRYRPPGLATASDAWVPRPIAWIDLDENGPRIMGIVAASPEEMAIGMRVHLRATEAWSDEDGREAVGYEFVPVAGGER